VSGGKKGEVPLHTAKKACGSGPRLVPSLVLPSLAARSHFDPPLHPAPSRTRQATGRVPSDGVSHAQHNEVAFKWSISDTAVLEAGKNAQYISGNQRDAIFIAISWCEKNHAFEFIPALYV
jgi:hypothetical protein